MNLLISCYKQTRGYRKLLLAFCGRLSPPRGKTCRASCGTCTPDIRGCQLPERRAELRSHRTVSHVPTRCSRTWRETRPRNDLVQVPKGEPGPCTLPRLHNVVRPGSKGASIAVERHAVRATLLLFCRHGSATTGFDAAQRSHGRRRIGRFPRRALARTPVTANSR